MADAIPHSSQSHPGPAFLNGGQFLIGHALAVILNLHSYVAIFMSQADVCAVAAGMAQHIGQALLHDAEDGQLDILRQPYEILRDFEIDLERASVASSPSMYQRSAAAIPFASRSGGCSKYDVVRISWVMRCTRSCASRSFSAKRGLPSLASCSSCPRFMPSTVRVWPALSCSSREMRRRSLSCNCSSLPERSQVSLGALQFFGALLNPALEFRLSLE